MTTITTTDNASTVKNMYGLLGNGDIEAWGNGLSPNIEVHTPTGSTLFHGPYIGREAVLNKFLPDLMAAFEGFSVAPETFHAVGDLVYVRGNYHVTKGGETTNVPFVHVINMDNGLWTRYQSYNDTAWLNALGNGN